MNDTNESKYGILENVQFFQGKDLACNGDESKKKEHICVFFTRKCNTIASNLGKILRGAYDSRASFADDYLASILSL